MDTSVNYILRWFFEAIYSLMWFIVLNRTHNHRYSSKTSYLILFCWFFAYMIISRLLPFMSLVRMLLFEVILFFVCRLCYTDAWWKILFSVAMIFMVLITNEMIGVGLYFPAETLAGEQESLTTPAFIQFWLTYLFTGALLYFLLYLFLNRQKFQLRAADWGMFALFAVSQYMLMYGWLDTLRTAGNRGRNVFFVLVMCACVLSDIGLFAAVTRIAQRARLAAENNMLSSQVDSQEKYYKALTDQYEGIRRMRHDIANHLNAMESLLSSGHSDEAQEYLQELNAIPFDSTLGLCEHPVVDAFLHSKLETARAQGIKVKASVSLTAGTPVSNVDLICVFGNLIDNATEACTGLENAWINISCVKSKGCLIISTSNPLRPRPQSKHRRIPELERGVGKAVLEDIAGKYNGSLYFSETDGTFTTQLILNPESR